MGAYCVEPQSRKIVFKVAGSFGDASYTALPVKNDGARQRLTSMIQIRDSLRELLKADIFDHLLAVIPYFNLRIYQYPEIIKTTN